MTKAPFGVLLLHGFTSHISCIDPVAPLLEKHQIPYRMPVLRGHGGKPSALEGVKWQDWVEDGQKALDELLTECEQVIPVSLSMGSLVAFELTRQNPGKICAQICLNPALKTKSKLSLIAPLIVRLNKTIHFKFDPRSYFDLEQARLSQNLNDIPSFSLLEFVKFAAYSRNPVRLKQLNVPILILASTHDRTIDPKVYPYLYKLVPGRPRQLVWFHRTGHEILRDAQRYEVLDYIEAYLLRQIELPRNQESLVSSQ
jgi:carboxylesterase